MLGLARVEYPAQCCDCLFPLRRRYCSHQLGLYRSIERHCLADSLCAAKLLHPVHRVLPCAAVPKGAHTRGALLARAVRNGNQHHLTHIPHQLLYFLFLPNVTTGECSDHELELRHVWRYRPVCYELLRLGRQAHI